MKTSNKESHSNLTDIILYLYTKMDNGMKTKADIQEVQPDKCLILAQELDIWRRKLAIQR